MTGSAETSPSGRMGQIWDWALIRPRLAILTVCLVALIPGFFTTPPLDRDESRYAQASRQMMETGDYIEIRFQDEARNKKPVGIYWMQVVTASIFGGADSAPIWAYRLPSLLAALAAAMATWWAGGILFNRKIALLGALLAGVSLSAVVEGHIAKTDAMLLLTVVLSQAALAGVYLSARKGEDPPGWGLTTLFWVAQGVGILVKGPIAPMVSGLTFLALSIADRDFKWILRLRPFSGVLMIAAIAAPWLIAIGIATDGAFFVEAIGNDMGGKLISSQERHGGIPGYHLLLLSLMFWPASLYIWPAFRRTWDTRAEPAVRFCMAWIVPTWVIFELTPTKLPHYVLPTYPAIALLLAAFIFACAGTPTRLGGRIAVAVWMVVTLLLASAAVAVPAIYGEGPQWLALPLALGIAAGVFWVISEAWFRISLGASLRALAVGLLTMATVFHITLPSLTDLALAPRLAIAVDQNQGPGDPPTASTGYTEPSLVFLLGTDTVLGPPERVAQHLAATPGAVGLVSQHHRDAFLAEAMRLSLPVEEVETVDGFNYSGGDPLTMSVFLAQTGASE